MNKLFVSCAIAAAAFMAVHAAQAATPYPGGIWEPPPVQYDVGAVVSTSVTMDDGTVLQARINYPVLPGTATRAPGKFPVILEFTPYSINNANTYFVNRGYISVRVGARGTGAGANAATGGPGPIDGGPHGDTDDRDGLDGKTIIEWAANELEGSDGRIGLTGCSFPAGYAMQAAGFVGRNSPLKAVYAACQGYEAQAREAWLINGLLTKGSSGITFGVQLHGNHPASAAFYSAALADLLAGGEVAYPGAPDGFWSKRAQMSLVENVVRNEVPMMLHVGWDDVLETPALRTYIALQNEFYRRLRHIPSNGDWDAAMEPGQLTTPRYQIVVGSWGHGGGQDPAVRFQWFETWIRGVNTGLQNTTTPMHLQERSPLPQAQQRWVNHAGWPSVDYYTKYYLNGSLLDTALPSTNVATPLVWGTQQTAASALPPGAPLSFTTTPYAYGATLSGPVSATLYASSSNTNLQFMAKLYDVAPDGTAVVITQGAIVGSVRENDPARSWTDSAGVLSWPYQKLAGDSFLTPGQVYRFDVSLRPREWAVQPGHSLRLQLQGQNDTSTEAGNTLYCGGGLGAPEICPRLLTATQAATLPGGVYSVRSGPSGPSALNLPLLPANAIPAAVSGLTPTSGTTVQSADWGPKGCWDLVETKAALGSRVGDKRYLLRADRNNNGRVDILDLAAVARESWNGCAAVLADLR